MKEYILEIKKVIPSILCKKIISYFDNNYFDAKTTGAGVDKDIRNCTTRNLFDCSSFGQKIYSLAVQEKVFGCVQQYKNRHKKLHIDKISQLDLLKYETNTHKAGYNFHYDMGLTCTERQLSISICLNNNFEGGEFVFDTPEGDYIFPQNEGDAVIFPSNFMYPHQVNKVTKGTRYALIAWVI